MRGGRRQRGLTTVELLIVLGVLIGVAVVVERAVEGGATTSAQCVAERMNAFVGGGSARSASCGLSRAARAEQIGKEPAGVAPAMPAGDGRDAPRQRGGGAFSLPSRPAGITPAALHAPARVGRFAVPPRSPQDAPAQVDLSELQAQFDELWKRTSPAGGDTREHGGTLVTDRQGNLKLTRVGNGAKDAFEPDLATGPGEIVRGIFHTHPKEFAGQAGLGFSARDTAYLFEKDLNVTIAQSGRDQFMYLRTAETPELDFRTVEEAHLRRMAVSWGQGVPITEYTRQAARESARAYGLAYYEGKDGVFTRVAP